MKLYTFSDARQRFSSVLDVAKKEGKVLIRRRDGSLFSLKPEDSEKSPLDVDGVNSLVSTSDIVEILREERGRTSRWS